MSGKVKVLLDTDIGTDIDDAVALAYLLGQERCELLGITTLTGEPDRRAEMASAMCRVAGKRVPIHCGAPLPLRGAQRQTGASQASALSRWPHDTGFAAGTAAEFLRQTIRQHPGEVTLLTIGPLTNLAILLAIDPEIAGLLRGVVSMVGKFAERLPNLESTEWNARLDATATAMVFERRFAFHRSVGVDVTRQVTLPREEARARFTSKLLGPVRDFAEVWFDQSHEVVFHDPLAAAMIFEPTLCGYERGEVTVETAGEMAGATVFRADAAGRHEVAASVDRGRFLDHYFSVTG